MKLRSAITATVEAPLPRDILVPTERAPDSFDFLALPQEIRACVYRLCLVSNDEISLNEGRNAYYVLNYPNGNPSRLHSQAQGLIQVHVPCNFVYPRTPNALINFVPPSTGHYLGISPNPQVIPIGDIDQPADLRNFPMRSAPSKPGSDPVEGVYIGPIHSDGFSYLSPCTYTPFMLFNARILQTCKTIYAESSPILYSKNRFVLHDIAGVEHFFKRLVGPPVAYLVDLRLEVAYLSIRNKLIDASGSNSLWSTILRHCKQLQWLRLSCRDSHWYESLDYVKSVIRVAANMADMKKGTSEPRMIMKAILDDFTRENDTTHFNARLCSDIQQTMERKTIYKMQLPRGPTIELTGRVSTQQLLLVQSYTRKGWCFKGGLPGGNNNVEPGTWVELEWVRNQE